jgi:hypothetical protein
MKNPPSFGLVAYPLVKGKWPFLGDIEEETSLTWRLFQGSIWVQFEAGRGEIIN